MIPTRKAVPEILYPPVAPPPRVKLLLRGCALAGLVGFVAGLLLGESQRTWQIYFVNFLFWSGLAQGGVIMAAVYRITNAHWGDHFRRIGEGMIAFLPLSFVLYVILVAGGGGLFPWLHERFPGKDLWLSGPFLFGRDGLVFLFLMWLSYRFVYHSVRPDLGLLRDRTGEADISWWGRRLTKNWRGWEIEKAESVARLARITPGLLIAFALLYSLIGFDLVMALDPRWSSTLYGWLYFVHAFYAGLVVITMLAVVSRKWFGTLSAFREAQWHDMGRFVFGICLLSGGFFWSQFLVIWYGNLPEETSYLIRRFYSQPWEPLMWAYIIFAYLFPLAVFLSRRVKEVPGALMVITSIILGALFLERFIAVVPFIWIEPTVPFGVIELAVTLGFAGAFVLSWLRFTAVVPMVPAAPSQAAAGH